MRAKRQSPEAGEDPASPATPITLPTITSLQFLVLDLLSHSDSPVSAHQLKLGLATWAQDYEGPKFYQLMGRLVRDQLVSSESKTIDTPGGSVERTFYTPTETGQEAGRLTRIFYTTRHQLRTAISSE